MKFIKWVVYLWLVAELIATVYLLNSGDYDITYLANMTVIGLAAYYIHSNPSK